MKSINRPLRISPSSLATFNKCSMQFKWNVIDEIEPDENSDNLFAVLGSAFHKAMELNDLYDISLEDLRKSWKIIFLKYMSDTKYLDRKTSYSFFQSRGFQLLRKGMDLKKRWKDKASVIFNEKYFRIPLTNKFLENVYISGKIDLAIRNKEEDIITILDWKTSKNIDKNIDNNDQISIYIYFVHSQLKFDYENIFGALVYPQIEEIIFTQRTEQDVQKVFAKINLMLERIANSDFKKEPLINKKKDDCTFCAFTKYCKTHEL
jgi:CRISPR/Cas system-associated exonuclease Cas4 (RecB family)